MKVHTQFSTAKPQNLLTTTSRHVSHRSRAHRFIVRSTVVHESLTLLPLTKVPEEDAAEIVDKLWSMQYVVPGPICGSAGKLVPLAATAGGAATPPPPASHAVLFRYPQPAVQQRFLTHLKVKEALQVTTDLATQEVPTLCFNGEVPNELEAIFRKGGEWDAGHELIVALAMQEGSPVEDGAEFLNLTQQLATSSAYGAVQASYGPFTELLTAQPEAGGKGARAQKPDFLLLVRFQTAEQMEGFAMCPAVAAMLEGDERSPLKTLWAGVLVVEPSEAKNSSDYRSAQM